MKSLSDEQRRELTERLQQRESALYEDLRREIGQREDLQRLRSEVPDAGDAALAALIADLQRADERRDIQELRAIGIALQRMESGEYGRCVDCGQDIPFERLRAQPEAMRCITCQSTYERTHAGQGRPATL